jgi:diphthamide biosynthesis protein 3
VVNSHHKSFFVEIMGATQKLFFSQKLPMTSFYDEIEIEDMEFNEEEETYYFPCPCGDKFQITLEELRQGDEIAHCPSCSLLIRY